MSRKVKGKYSTLGKRLMGEVVYPMLRKTRSEWLKLDCLNSSFQGVKAPAEETTAEILLPLHTRVVLLLGEHFSAAPNANEAFKGSERRT